jgi:hypothetical protein
MSAHNADPLSNNQENIMAKEQQLANPPFSMGYVLRTTAKHMRKSIDISIRKTGERIAEFGEAGDSPKSREVFETLSVLHIMRKQLDDF